MPSDCILIFSCNLIADIATRVHFRIILWDNLIRLSAERVIFYKNVMKYSHIRDKLILKLMYSELVVMQSKECKLMLYDVVYIYRKLCLKYSNYYDLTLIASHSYFC